RKRSSVFIGWVLGGVRLSAQCPIQRRTLPRSPWRGPCQHGAETGRETPPADVGRTGLLAPRRPAPSDLSRGGSEKKPHIRIASRGAVTLNPSTKSSPRSKLSDDGAPRGGGRSSVCRTSRRDSEVRRVLAAACTLRAWP